MSQTLNITYSVPISESAFVDNDFIIKGTAINETTTSNNHKFIGEELQKAAKTLTGCPLLVDHENKVENIKGRVLIGSYNEGMHKIDFKAKVMDKICQEMIKDGRLNSVSVGAIVGDLEEEDGGVLIPKSITFKELSLVAVPADSGATFSIAMKEAYNSLPKKIVKEEIENPAEEVKTEDEIETEDDTDLVVEDKLKVSQEIPENATEVVKEVQGSDLDLLKGGLKKMSEEKITETVIASVDTSKEFTEKIAALEKANKELSEKLTAMEAPKAVVLKNEFEEESEADVKEGYKIIQGNGFFSYVQDKY